MVVCRLVIQILTLFQTQKCHFSHSFSDLAFEKLCHHYLDWNTNGSDFLISPFLFLSYSFGIERINTFIHSRSSLENHTRFQTKMDKVYTRFQTKTDPTLWGGTYLCGTYIPPGLNLSRTYFRAIKIARSLNEDMRTIYT